MAPTKKQRRKEKDGIVYPTAEDVIRINKAVLGDKQALTELPDSIRKNIEDMAKQFKPRPLQRIPQILDALRELWQIRGNTDMRFGQLLLNFPFREIDYRDKTSLELYAAEDDKTLELIKEAIKECNKRKAKEMMEISERLFVKRDSVYRKLNRGKKKTISNGKSSVSSETKKISNEKKPVSK